MNGKLLAARLLALAVAAFELFGVMIARAFLCFDACPSEPRYSQMRLVLLSLGILFVAGAVGPWIRHRNTALGLTLAPVAALLIVFAMGPTVQAMPILALLAAVSLLAAYLVSAGITKTPPAK